jgi:hypothetical protein
LAMPRIDCWSSTIRTLTALAFGMVLLTSTRLRPSGRT